MQDSVQAVGEFIGHLFRREGRKVVAALTRKFGMERLDLAEDILQEVLLKALDQWTLDKIPPNPEGWMLVTARNLAIDHIRRESFLMLHEIEIAEHFTVLANSAEFIPILDTEIDDDLLRMIFTCCHPILSRESQVAFTLRTLAGFSTKEIARVMMTEEANIARRILRAKEKMRETLVEFEVPTGEALEERLNAVLNVLYLIFTLGYQTSTADRTLQKESCEDALRLTLLLRSHPAGASAKVSALLALMYFQLARFDARWSPGGIPLSLQEQDRAIWRPDLIKLGNEALQSSEHGEVLTPYHVEAAIAHWHCAAKTYEETDWKSIVNLYEILAALTDSKVVEIGRANAKQAMEGLK